VGDIALMDKSGTPYVPVPDQVGTTWNLLNSGASKANSYGYDAFGVARSVSETVSNLYRFGTKRLDVDSALYHFMARQYKSSVGRLLSQEPRFRALTGKGFGLDTGITAVGHWWLSAAQGPFAAGGNATGGYVFCGGSPARLVDPMGLRPIFGPPFDPLPPSYPSDTYYCAHCQLCTESRVCPVCGARLSLKCKDSPPSEKQHKRVEGRATASGSLLTCEANCVVDAAVGTIEGCAATEAVKTAAKATASEFLKKATPVVSVVSTVWTVFGFAICTVECWEAHETEIECLKLEAWDAICRIGMGQPYPTYPYVPRWRQ